MRIGWVGLGQLGLPCAEAQQGAGHEVVGTDLVRKDWSGYRDSIEEVVAVSDLIFLAVQTPHAPKYGGETRLRLGEYRDFEYKYLETAYRAICKVGKPATVAVVSTCLPGTIGRLLQPITPDHINLVYHPFFIAQGTVKHDYLHPEFVLLGTDDSDRAETLRELYGAMLSPTVPIVTVSIESAELAKMAYNTFISLKIIVANSIMEMCEGTGADCDEVVDVLQHATQRLWSTAYMRGGMGDGGACHPRDNVALAFLADRIGQSYNLFAAVISGRQHQAEFVADAARKWAELTGLPVALCGSSYKADMEIDAGSAAFLVRDLLDGSTFAEPGTEARVFVITCNHSRYADVRWPVGSVVVDPWGYISDQPGVIAHRLGRKNHG